MEPLQTFAHISIPLKLRAHPCRPVSPMAPVRAGGLPSGCGVWLTPAPDLGLSTFIPRTWGAGPALLREDDALTFRFTRSMLLRASGYPPNGLGIVAPLGAPPWEHLCITTFNRACQASFSFFLNFFWLGPSGLIPEVTVGSLIIGFHQEPFFQLLRGEELFLVDFPIFISHDLDLLKIFGEGE